MKNNIQLIETSKLKHIEGFSKKRVQWLKNKIINEQIWTKPLCIDKEHYLVMDGQHRMEVAKDLELKKVPCILYDYKEVEIWSLRDNWNVSIELIIKKALENDIYPYKTVKHRFPVDVELCNIHLDKLKK